MKILIPQIPAFLGDSDIVSDLVKISNFVSDSEFFNSISSHPWDPIKLLLLFGHIYSIREKVRKRTTRDKEKEGLRKKLEAESGTVILLLIDKGMKGIDVRGG